MLSARLHRSLQAAGECIADFQIAPPGQRERSWRPGDICIQSTPASGVFGGVHGLVAFLVVCDKTALCPASRWSPFAGHLG